MAGTSSAQLRPLAGPKAPSKTGRVAGISTERKVQAGFAFALLCLSIIGAAAYNSVEQLRANALWLDRSREVVGRLGAVFSDVTELQNSWRGYALTGDETFLSPMGAARPLVADELERLRELLADDQLQEKRIDLLATLIDAELSWGQRIIDARRAQGMAAAVEMTASRRGEELHNEIRQTIRELRLSADALLQRRDARARRSVKTRRRSSSGAAL
jgi:methyl-accepting chemotaxis protein